MFKLLTPEVAGEVLKEVSSSIQEGLTNELDDQTIAHILNELDSDDATDIVSALPRERAQEIIGLVQPDVSEELQKLLGYKTDMAGGRMALEFVSVNADSTIGEAIENIREKREEVENIEYFGEKYREYMEVTKMFIPYVL